MITINELFSGIGAQVAALKRLGIEYETVGIAEIDRFAIQSYEAINGKTRNYGDISKVEKLDYADLWTYSSPCQDFSIAGRQKGIYDEDGGQTRSGLLLEVERLLRKAVADGKAPKYLLLENVKNLVGKKFRPDFDRWLNTLEELGYNNYWKVLNAKDYGVPQNRERVFVVSIRKDLNQTYMFPDPVPLKMRLKDLLESEVDEKYYLPQEKVEKLALNLNKDVSNTIRCGGGSLDGKHTLDIVIDASRGRNPENPSDGSRQALTAHLHKETANDCTKFERHSPATEVLKIKANTKKGYDIAKEGDSINLEQPNSTTRRGRIGKGKGKAQTLTTSCNQGVLEIGVKREVLYKITKEGNIRGFQNDEKKSGASESQFYNSNNVSGSLTTQGVAGVLEIGNIFDTDSFGGNPQVGRVYDTKGLSPCIDTMGGGNRQPKVLENGIRIRKLTPKECWRLMDFTDEEFEAAQKSGVSKTQLYKQAGNSIVVAVLAAIFKNLFQA